MARPYSTEDAKKLILQYQQLRTDLRGIVNQTQKANQSDVEKAASTVLNSKVLADSIVDDLRRGQSKAPKTFDTQALMAALYKFIQCAPVVDRCRSLSNEYTRQVDDSLHALQTVTSPLRRLFAGSKAKAAADAAYETLYSLAVGVFGDTIHQSSTEIKRNNSVSSATAFSDYESDPATYYKAFRDCASGLVNADRPLKQMIPIIARHETLLGQYRDASARVEQKLVSDQQSIRQCAEKALAARVMEQLHGFEVESLSQRRGGIRVKALKDAGYNTIEDVFCATVSNLASVHGISEDAANIIKTEARKMAQDVQKTIKLKISSDDRTPEITALLTAVYSFIRNKALVDSAEPIDKSSKTVVKGIDAFSGLTNVFSWMFLPDRGRAYYSGIYQELSSLIDSDYL